MEFQRGGEGESGGRHIDTAALESRQDSMTQLIKYNAARHALAIAKQVDEVKEIRDQAEAMRVYARLANDKTMEIDAAEIRMRSERRLGEMIAAQKAGPGLNKGGRPAETPADEEGVISEETPAAREGVLPTLAEVGISHKLSSQAQAMAAVPEAEFEKEIGDWRERVSAEDARVTTRLVAAGKKANPALEVPAPDEDGRDDSTAEVNAAIEELYRIATSDDVLAAALDTVKQQDIHIRHLTAENSRLMNELAGVTGKLNYLKKKVGK